MDNPCLWGEQLANPSSAYTGEPLEHEAWQAQSDHAVDWRRTRNHAEATRAVGSALSHSRSLDTRPASALSSSSRQDARAVTKGGT